MSTDTRLAILRQLSDGRFHAGTKIAGTLGVTRAAVWKHVRYLRSQGLSIDSVNGKGYRLCQDVELLQEELLRKFLSQYLDAEIDLALPGHIESTNQWLLDRGPALSQGATCIAEQQSAGRGTRGRRWLSPPGCNIYLSVFWHFERAPGELGGLSLAVAVAVVDSLSTLGYEGLMLKWPNDIHSRNGKLGGILIDIQAESNGPSRAIIGLGLNYGMDNRLAAEIDQPVDDLGWIGRSAGPGRNRLAALLAASLHRCCRTYAVHGFEPFRVQWSRWDMVRDKPVILQYAGGHVEGLAKGVDESGALTLEVSDGTRAFASGDVSMRVAKK